MQNDLESANYLNFIPLINPYGELETTIQHQIRYSLNFSKNEGVSEPTKIIQFKFFINV